MIHVKTTEDTAMVEPQKVNEDEKRRLERELDELYRAEHRAWLAHDREAEEATIIQIFDIRRTLDQLGRLPA